MCITFFSILQNSATGPWKFIMAFNREEQTQRQTLPWGPFEQDSNIRAGRDMISKGTWLGFNIKTGVLVLLTNYDQDVPRFGRSRGKLVYSFLKSDIFEGVDNQDKLIESRLSDVLQQQEEYTAFNLMVYNSASNRAYYLNNKQGLKKPKILKHNQNYGLCNVKLDTVWPKTAHGLKLYEEATSNLSQDQTTLQKKLSSLLQDQTSFNQDEQAEASIFVKPYYNIAEKAQRRTKTSTVILLSKEGTLYIKQYSWETGKVVQEHHQL